MNQQGIGQKNAHSYLWMFACRGFTVTWTSDNLVSLSWRLADSSPMASRGEGRLRKVVPSWKKALSSFFKLSAFTLGLISVDRKLEEKYFHILLGPETGKQIDRFIPQELKLWVMNYLCQTYNSISFCHLSIYTHTSFAVLIVLFIIRKEEIARKSQGSGPGGR